MIKIGKFNRLKIINQFAKEFQLDAGDSKTIALPLQDAPKNSKVGDELNVFVYPNAKNELIASTKIPLAQVDDVAWLTVISESSAGAFLDWGLPKDILLPFPEQSQKVTVGRAYLVKIFLDEDNRVAASMLLDDFIQDESFYFKEGQQVDLMIADETDLGRKAIINNEFWGVLYKNEIFQQLRKGQKTKGFIKKIREDNKIDLVLQMDKYGDKVDLVTEKILAKLKSQDGFIAVSDKSPPDLIYKVFGVSKKVFKQSVGGLYKKRLIFIDKDGMTLLDNKTEK